MADLIDIPAGAQAALDAGAMYVRALSLTLPAAQSADGNGAPWLLTNWHRDIAFEGNTYLHADSPFLRCEFSTAKQSAEGTVALVFSDPRRVWQNRMAAAGVRGRDAVILTLLPYRDGNRQRWWRMDRFAGKTETQEPRADQREGPLLRIVVEDALFRAKEVPGEFTSDGFQRKLSAAAGQDPYDDSHKATPLSRTVHWHSR